MALHKIPVDSFPCFTGERQLRHLNAVLDQRRIMPHVVAGATGCEVQDAFNLLMFLVNRYLAKPYLLIYHLAHAENPPVPVAVRRLEEGMPDLPYWCPECEMEVVEPSELTYDFLFVLEDSVILVVEDDAVI